MVRHRRFASRNTLPVMCAKTAGISDCTANDASTEHRGFGNHSGDPPSRPHRMRTLIVLRCFFLSRTRVPSGSASQQAASWLAYERLLMGQLYNAADQISALPAEAREQPVTAHLIEFRLRRLRHSIPPPGRRQ